MFGRIIKKWLPVALVLVFMALAAALITWLPEEPRGRAKEPMLQPSHRDSSAPPAPAPIPQPSPDPTNPDPREDLLDTDDELPAFPPLLDDEDKEYPTPFSTPDPMPDEST